MTLDRAASLLRYLAGRGGAPRHGAAGEKLRASFAGTARRRCQAGGDGDGASLFPIRSGLRPASTRMREIPDAMLKLGFGFVECGTVTPRPQTGNPRPRLFRLRRGPRRHQPHGLQQSRHGGGGTHVWKPAQSAAALSASISAPTRTAPIASPIMRRASRRLAPLADYVTVNVSSPNTPGLRGLQNKDELTRLLSALSEAREMGVRKPLLLKIAPDLDESRAG